MKLKEAEINETIGDILRKYIGRKKEQPAEPDYDTVSLVNDPNCRSGKEWAEKGGNFPIKRNGKIYYVSRSVTVSLYAFCKNRFGEWCVLVNKRGPKTRGAGAWNVPSGYLDYKETAEHAACREAFEECGVKIDEHKIVMQGVNSSRENVAIRYAVKLEGTTDQYPTDISNCEPGEVSAAGWLPLSKANRVVWNRRDGAENVWGQAETTINYNRKTGGIYDDLPSKINNLKQMLKRNPRAYQLFSQILQDLKDYKAL